MFELDGGDAGAGAAEANIEEAAGGDAPLGGEATGTTGPPLWFACTGMSCGVMCVTLTLYQGQLQRIPLKWPDARNVVSKFVATWVALSNTWMNAWACSAGRTTGSCGVSVNCSLYEKNAV